MLPGGALAFANSEVSALRVLRDGEVSTLVGQGLFDWGSDDGDRLTARLQHPLGVAALPDGAIVVADTFNSLLRVWRDGRLSTLPLSPRRSTSPAGSMCCPMVAWWSPTPTRTVWCSSTRGRVASKSCTCSTAAASRCRGIRATSCTSA